jgi:putative oxidoreductase
MKRVFSSILDSSLVSWGLLILRLAVGGLMLTHGWPKLQMLMAGKAASFADPVGLGPEISLYLVVFAEVVCPILLILGLGTRLATIPIIIDMLVALFVVHSGQPFSSMELAIFFTLTNVAILLAGPGLYSIDAWINSRRESRDTKEATSHHHRTRKEETVPVVVREVRTEVVDIPVRDIEKARKSTNAREPRATKDPDNKPASGNRRKQS